MQFTKPFQTHTQCQGVCLGVGKRLSSIDTTVDTNENITITTTGWKSELI